MTPDERIDALNVVIRDLVELLVAALDAIGDDTRDELVAILDRWEAVGEP